MKNYANTSMGDTSKIKPAKHDTKAKKSTGSKSKPDKPPKKTKREQDYAYLSPNKMMSQITSYGYTYSFKNMLITYVIYMAVCVAIGYIMRLDLLHIAGIFIIGLLFLPGIIVRKYFNKNQQQKFDDANVYMEQILYSFRVHKMILPALQDLEMQFKPGNMQNRIKQAQKYILDSPTSSDNLMQEALMIIEKDYRCDKMITIHRFMERVESIGGNFNSIVDLLLQDRNAWELRQIDIQNMRAVKKRNVFMSCCMSIMLCIIFMLCLPQQYDITQQPMVQHATWFLWFGMFALYSKADKRASVNLLDPSKNDMSESAARRRYNKIANWDEKIQFMKSVRYSLVTLLITMPIALVVMVRKEITWGIFISIGLSALMLLQHKLDYKASANALINEIHMTFPRWMIEMALLLQTESVQVALTKSYENCPPVLKPEVELLLKRLQETPEDVRPFLDFLGTFHLKDVQSAMSVLYSIQAGAGGDPETQITDIVRRNNQMLEITEKKVAENSMASLSGLFMAPLLVGGVKLGVDMLAFLSVAIGSLM